MAGTPGVTAVALERVYGEEWTAIVATLARRLVARLPQGYPATQLRSATGGGWVTWLP